MELESNLLLSQAKQLYHITPLWEITTLDRISGAKNGGHCQTGTECKQPAL